LENNDPKLREELRQAKIDKMRIFDSGNRLGPLTLRFLWNGGLKLQENSVGLRVFNDRTWLARLSAFAQPRPAKSAPTLLFLGSGLHDVSSKNRYFNFQLYRDQVRTALLRAMGTRAKVFWVAASPKFRGIACGGAEASLALGQPGVYAMNLIAKSVVEEVQNAALPPGQFRPVYLALDELRFQSPFEGGWGALRACVRACLRAEEPTTSAGVACRRRHPLRARLLVARQLARQKALWVQLRVARHESDALDRDVIAAAGRNFLCACFLLLFPPGDGFRRLAWVRGLARAQTPTSVSTTPPLQPKHTHARTRSLPLAWIAPLYTMCRAPTLPLPARSCCRWSIQLEAVNLPPPAPARGFGPRLTRVATCVCVSRLVDGVCDAASGVCQCPSTHTGDDLVGRWNDCHIVKNTMHSLELATAIILGVSVFVASVAVLNVLRKWKVVEFRSPQVETDDVPAALPPQSSPLVSDDGAGAMFLASPRPPSMANGKRRNSLMAVNFSSLQSPRTNAPSKAFQQRVAEVRRRRLTLALLVTIDVYAISAFVYQVSRIVTQIRIEQTWWFQLLALTFAVFFILLSLWCVCCAGL
jgi:hypothetical protein